MVNRQTYLTLLREGSLVETIRAVIGLSLAQHRSSIRTAAVVSNPDAAAELPLAHKKAVIVLDTVEGFGPYRITVSAWIYIIILYKEYTGFLTELNGSSDRLP